MLQVIDGKSVFVVDFDTMPELPITGFVAGEEAYVKYIEAVLAYADSVHRVSGSLMGLTQKPMTYADALNDAIETEQLTEPGKYGIYLDRPNRKYEIFKIVE